MTGWVKIYRELLETPLFSSAERFRFFILLIMLAQHKPQQYYGIEVGRGQLITSIRQLARRCGMTPKKVRCALQSLEFWELIKVEPTRKYSLITICNYDSYQGLPPENKSKGHS